MKVFLTGATGYIGTIIAEKLQEAGHTVVGLARNDATANLLAKQNIESFYILTLEKASGGSTFHAATESGISELEIAEAISRVLGYKTKGIDSNEAIAKWGVGIAAFFSINNQISANKARQKLDWKPQTA